MSLAMQVSIVGGLNVDLGLFQKRLDRASRRAGQMGGASRRDSAGRPRGRLHNLADYRRKVNEQRINRTLRNDGLRKDGFSANAGFNLARDLEDISSEVLEEKFPIPNALKYFSVDTSVAVGATTYTLRRIYSMGQARVYGGPGSRIPRVSVQKREESFNIRHIVCGYAWDIFEDASAGYANSGLLGQLARVARDAIMELANRIWWGLDNVGQIHGLYGVLDYPWLPKQVIAQSFDKATVEANPRATLAILHEIVNFPHENSKSVFQPDSMLMTNAVYDVLSSVPLSAGSDTTIMAHFLANSKHIGSVDIAHELEDAGGAGVDGILAYRKDSRGIQITMPQGITQLPVQENGLEKEVINYMSLGGAVMKDVLNNILALVDTNAA